VILLALDTSTAWGSVAVYDGSAVVAEETWRAQRRHGDELFPAIDRVLALAGAVLPDVERIAVATGPGSFTGLRVAIAAGQGMARGSGAALVGVPTLDVVAAAQGPWAGRACALVPAGRTEHYAAFYEWSGREWERRSEFTAGRLSDLVRGLDEPTLFAGEIDGASEQELTALLGPNAVIVASAARARRAGYLAELGWRALERLPRERLPALEPVYVRPPAIRTGEGTTPAVSRP
jgi:tRNA threonylcarbamoyladenosine biosynthesis protein TsaB